MWQYQREYIYIYIANRENNLYNPRWFPPIGITSFVAYWLFPIVMDPFLEPVAMAGAVSEAAAAAAGMEMDRPTGWDVWKKVFHEDNYVL